MATLFALCIFSLLWSVNGANKYNKYLINMGRPREAKVKGMIVASNYGNTNSERLLTCFTLLKITPYNYRQLKYLINLVDSGEVEVLKYSHGLNDTTDVLAPPSKWRKVERLAKTHKMSIQYKTHYGRYFEKEAVKLKMTSNAYSMFKYNSHKAITKHLQTLAKENSKMVKLETICESYEGRPLKLFKISANHKANNPIVFIDAGIHAREWVAPALAMYIIDQLVIAAKKMPHKADQLLGLDWYILPMVNPDGYEFSRARPLQRMWRKTRSKTWREGCFGVDLNRNFGYKWGYSGVSFDPCDSEIYAGRGPFSERESRFVRQVMWRYSKRIKLYVAIHAYGQYFVYPWGYTAKVLPPEWKKLHRVAEIYSKAVVDAGGEPFKVMSAGQWYPSAGASDDFAFGKVKIPYCFTLEITDGHEFIFPEKLLPTTLPPLYEGFKVMAREIKKEFVHKAK